MPKVNGQFAVTKPVTNAIIPNAINEQNLLTETHENPPASPQSDAAARHRALNPRIAKDVSFSKNNQLATEFLNQMNLEVRGRGNPDDLLNALLALRFEPSSINFAAIRALTQLIPYQAPSSKPYINSDPKEFQENIDAQELLRKKLDISWPSKMEFNSEFAIRAVELLKLALPYTPPDELKKLSEVIKFYVEHPYSESSAEFNQQLLKLQSDITRHLVSPAQVPHSKL